MGDSMLVLKRIFFGFFLFTSLTFASHAKSVVYVYDDEGVDHTALRQAVHTLKTALPKGFQLKTIHAADVIDGRWTENAALLVMPGGADLPYAKRLNGKGNANIKRYVANGGAYLGLCAGAYYGAAEVVFDKGGALEVLGKRELAFFPGEAIGPILAPYYYQSNQGARAAPITLTDSASTTLSVYYNGGGYFKNARTTPNTTVIGTYQNHLPAIISVKYAKGRVILSGVHFEYDSVLLNPNDVYLAKLIAPLKASDKARCRLLHEVLMGLL